MTSPQLSIITNLQLNTEPGSKLHAPVDYHSANLKDQRRPESSIR